MRVRVRVRVRAPVHAHTFIHYRLCTSIVDLKQLEAHILALNGTEDRYFSFTMACRHSYYIAVAMNRKKLLNTADKIN